MTETVRRGQPQGGQSYVELVESDCAAGHCVQLNCAAIWVGLYSGEAMQEGGGAVFLTGIQEAFLTTSLDS